MDMQRRLVFELSVSLDTPAMRSGDDLAAALRTVAATLANRYDGLDLPEVLPDTQGTTIQDTDGQTVGRWEIG